MKLRHSAANIKNQPNKNVNNMGNGQKAIKTCIKWNYFECNEIKISNKSIQIKWSKYVSPLRDFRYRNTNSLKMIVGKKSPKWATATLHVICKWKHGNKASVYQ